MFRCVTPVLLAAGLIATFPAKAQTRAAEPVIQAAASISHIISSRTTSLWSTGLATGEAPANPSGVWAFGSYTDVKQTTPGAAFEGDLTNGVVGYDRFVTDRFLLGLTLSYERLDIDTSFLTGAGNLKGNGYGLTPYIGYRIDDVWSFDLSAGYYWLDYDTTSVGNTVSGSFDAERWVVNSSVNGVYRSGNWRFLPRVGVLYTKETQDAYGQSDGSTVAEEDIRLGRVYAGGRIGYATETMMPYIKLMGEYDFKRPGAQAIGNGQFTSDDDTGAQLGAGVEFFSTGPFSGAVEVGYNSLARDDLDVWNGFARLRMVF